MVRNKTFISILVTLLFIANNAFAGTTATVNVTATVLQGQSEISVDTANVDFGAVSGSVSNRRFVAGPVKVTYFAGTSPWTIRVYTANPNNVPGLIGVTDNTKSVPLKTWCDNYGPKAHTQGVPPDEENIYFWRGYDFNGINGIESTPITSGPAFSEINLGFDINGDGDALDVITPSPTKDSNIKYPVSEEPVWLRVPDYTQMNPADPYTWRRLLTQAWAEAPGDPGSPGGGGDPNRFPVYFAVDVTGISPQTYRTTTLTFQIIGE
ncbi:MAG: hypothetical protein PHO42_02055 [Candidatus Omnitrophica bacterium]|nr:hypothetical protein [Candidatus Omnitrophota bacterium]